MEYRKKTLCGYCILVICVVFLMYKYLTPGIDVVKRERIHTKNVLIHTAIERRGGNWMSVLGACDPRKVFLKSTLKFKGKQTPIFIHDPKTDTPISEHVAAQGTFEPGLIHGIVQYLGNNSKITFVDIGANIGVFSLSVAMMGYRVISVEPQMRNVERICQSVTVGGFRNYLTVIHNALSDSRGEVQLANGFHTFGSTYVVAKNPTSTAETVEAIFLDDLLEIFTLNKVVMKIDVEGFENKVLGGGIQFFEEVDIKVVCMEFDKHAQKPSGQVIIDFLMQRGFKAFQAFNDVHRPGEELDPKNYSKWPINIYWVKQ